MKKIMLNEPYHSNGKGVKMDLRKDFLINKAHLLFAFLVTLWEKMMHT